MQDKIIVRGAREHNLKNITVEIPRDKFTVITGLSGSGKSTLAFDTIYAEGQRRYVESLSAYARQFLGLMNKPDVDSIEGLSPAISIEQKSTSKNPRSTVGTITEIYDYLRLLFSRIGVVHCPKCFSELKPQTQENIASNIMFDKDKELMFLAPIIRGVKGTHEQVFETLKKEGFSKVRVDEQIYDLDIIKDVLKLERYEKHWVEAVIDTVVICEDERQRINEAVGEALSFGKGRLITIDVNAPKLKQKKEIGRGASERVYTTHGACVNHPEIVFEPLEPRMFSFNSPFGACSACHGLGEIMQISSDLILPDKSKSIIDGAIAIYNKMDIGWRAQQIAAVGKKFGFDVFTPLNNFTDKQLKVLLYGTDDAINAKWHNGASMNMHNGFEGVIPQTERLYKQTESDWRKEEIEKFMVSNPCKVCLGKKLKDTILAVKIDNKSIIDTTDLSISHAINFFKELEPKLSETEKKISQQVLKEINERLNFLENVGLGYLTLARSAKTLSGGEAQRIRLATQIGANLMGVVYILDEPSIGLHQRDNSKLIKTLKKLRDLGNTLIVVEHDEDTINSADHVIDIGPGAGVHGGRIIAQGSPKVVELNKESITGQYLSGVKKIAVPKTRRKPNGHIKVFGASENNLKKINVNLPLGVLCAITGVSGSGKSTLMNQIVMPYLKNHFGSVNERVGRVQKIVVPEHINNIIIINQDPIGKTPRSNPATYTKLFDEIRAVFAQTKQSKERGYSPGRFSFNVKGGRCESCSGDGVIKIEMNFLPDVFVECESCRGTRYNSETLQVHYKTKNISDVLNMSIDEALLFFENHSGISRKLKTLSDVGLGYIKLGQSSTTLSGGESQRVKIAKELSKLKKGNTVYMLDEPTTGLHFEDVNKLLSVLNRLTNKGNSIFVIEHNLDVIKNSDYIIDLGSEGGDGGGEIITEGVPEEIVSDKNIKKSNSHTAIYLKKVLEKKLK